MDIAATTAWLVLVGGTILALGAVVRRGRRSTQGRDPPASAERKPFVPPPQRADAARDIVDLELALPDDPGGAPASERQRSALRRLGIVDAATVTAEQANVLLSARDYADTLIGRTPRYEHPVARYKLLAWLIATEARRAYVVAWSWRTRNQDSRRMPRDEFRAAAEDFLKDF
jgi:hypothetical protein